MASDAHSNTQPSVDKNASSLLACAKSFHVPEQRRDLTGI